MNSSTCSWGLGWLQGSGVFPEYYWQAGSERVAIRPAEVPPETGLTTANFRPAHATGPYVSPTTGTNHIRLNDGSIVTFRWYRFVDQPALRHLALSEAERTELQHRVELIHSLWTQGHEYIPAPRFGKLAQLDRVLLVTPPAGLGIGYVPVVTRQE
jgi:hypothetical protein